MEAQIFDDNWSDVEEKDVCDLQGPILIIGGSGFLGARLLLNLMKRRKDVYAVSKQIEQGWRLLRLPDESLRQNLINLDINDLTAVNSLLDRIRPRTVFNLSAYGAYERQSKVQRIYDVNFIGTLNLILALMDRGCDAFVHAGSSSEYGINCAAPAENSELRPNSDYAVSKVAVSYLIQFYGRIRNFPCVNLRLYSVYGPWEERDRLIPNVIRNGLSKKLPPFAPAEISRDFIYVDDCLAAIVRAALTVCRFEPGLSINIASGIKTSLAEVASIAKELFDVKDDPQFSRMQARQWDLSNWYGNPKFGIEKLGWRARTSLREGLRLTENWERNASEILEFVTAPIKGKKISVIIACYRDDLAIPHMHRRLCEMFKACDVDYEIIFVNDNSPTKDEDVIQGICKSDSHVIGISHSRNFGSQSAFLSGTAIATGDAIVWMDGDLQDPPEVIPEFIEKWKTGNDIVYGIRVRREAPLYMQIMYKIFYRMFRSLSDIEVPLDAGDFSLMDRRVVEQLLKLREKDIFLRGLRAWVGFKQTGVPYVRPERMFGTTTNSLLKNIWWAKKAIFSFSVKPLAYIQRLGVSMFGLSFILAMFYFIHYFFSTSTAGRGATTIILLTLSLGGLQLFSLSILGEYVGKVLEEVKDRPRYIRSRIFKGNEVFNSQEAITSYLVSSRKSIVGAND